MSLYASVCHRVLKRQLKDQDHIGFQRALHVTPELVSRIGLEAELKGHSGCVNCLEWNEAGNLIASGSDDVQIIVWNPFKHRSLHTIRTGHTGNIFSVKFLPCSGDSILVSGAADCKIRVHELQSSETTNIFSCHAGRVKRIATAPNVPLMFWSAAEDGTIMQFDLRDPDQASGSNPKNVLINLRAHMGQSAEAKCLAINPTRPEQLAVGANDPYIRLYDRRMLSCKSIKFPADATSRSPWERPTFDLDLDPASYEDYSLPVGSTKYYIAGHLPQKQQEYKKRYRTLASTYLTFSPDGHELLVNLGGEQIYLFDVNRGRRAQKFAMPASKQHANVVMKEVACGAHSNGFTMHCNGTTANGVTKQLASHTTTPATTASSDAGSQQESRTCSSEDRGKSKKCRTASKSLSPMVDAIKEHANAVFKKQQFTQAIMLYNQALAIASDSALLYGNRAAAFMKRNWDGDLYAALRDCHTAIQLDADHLKAHFRLAKCLFELAWPKEALDCLQMFKRKFPDSATSQACQALDRDIRDAIKSRSKPAEETDAKRDQAAGKRRHDSISKQEAEWQSDSHDYEARFCGHCNTTTDIKEANFFGSNGQYIVAGSDDGSFFVWDRRTTNILRVLRGDDSIVNCLQPHPSYCLLATSGIDPVVRLWSPRAEDGKKDEREVDNSDDAASANQRRMNADPLEVMLMNMGYRITGVLDSDDEVDREGHEGVTPCRPS